MKDVGATPAETSGPPQNLQCTFIIGVDRTPRSDLGRLTQISDGLAGIGLSDEKHCVFARNSRRNSHVPRPCQLRSNGRDGVHSAPLPTMMEA